MHLSKMFSSIMYRVKSYSLPFFPFFPFFLVFLCLILPLSSSVFPCLPLPQFFDHVRDCRCDGFDMIVCVSGWCVVAGLVLVGMWLVSDMSQPPECKVRGRRGVLSCACAWVWVCINQWNAEERRGTQEDSPATQLHVVSPPLRSS